MNPKDFTKIDTPYAEIPWFRKQILFLAGVFFIAGLVSALGRG